MKNLLFLSLVITSFNIIPAAPERVEPDRIETWGERNYWFVHNKQEYDYIFRGRVYDLRIKDSSCWAGIVRRFKGITPDQQRQMVYRKYLAMFDEAINQDNWPHYYTPNPRVRLSWLEALICRAEKLKLRVPDDFKNDVARRMSNRDIFISDQQTKREIRTLKSLIQPQIQKVPGRN